MTEHDSDVDQHDSDADLHASEPLGSPDPSLGGATVEEAVENAEAGSQAEGDHAPFGDEPTVAPGESRGEQLRTVVPGAVAGPAA